MRHRQQLPSAQMQSRRQWPRSAGYALSAKWQMHWLSEMVQEQAISMTCLSTHQSWYGGKAILANQGTGTDHFHCSRLKERRALWSWAAAPHRSDLQS